MNFTVTPFALRSSKMLSKLEVSKPSFSIFIGKICAPCDLMVHSDPVKVGVSDKTTSPSSIKAAHIMSNACDEPLVSTTFSGDNSTS